MKVFATLATIVGASAATPLFQNHLLGANDLRMDHQSSNSVMKPTMGSSMGSRMSHGGNSAMRMDNHQMSNIRDMYHRDNQNMASNMMNHQVMNRDMHPNMINPNNMGQEMSSNMKDMHKKNQAIGFTGPNQYFVKDDIGNYVYSYDDQHSEKSEQGNDHSIKGQYAYIMSNGVKRKVEYIADNNGFHIIKDNADPARIKRSTEPELLQTRMTSMMGSPSLRDESRDMYRMSDMMGRDMPSNLGRNLMGMQQQSYSSMMGQETTGHNMMGQNTLEHNMMDRDSMLPNLMGQNIYSTMSNRGMPSDVSDRMGQHRNSNMMGQDMTMNLMGGNMMRLDRNSQMMGMLANQDMAPTTLYSNIMGQDMMDVSNNRLSSKMMNSRGRSANMMNAHSNNGLMGQRMMQKMEIERVPETYTSTRFF